MEALIVLAIFFLVLVFFGIFLTGGDSRPPAPGESKPPEPTQDWIAPDVSWHKVNNEVYSVSEEGSSGTSGNEHCSGGDSSGSCDST